MLHPFPIQITTAVMLFSGLLFHSGAHTFSQNKAPDDTTTVSRCDHEQTPPIYTFEEDIFIFENIILSAGGAYRYEGGLQDIMMAVAREFIGSPYLASTLEKEGDEELVINLRQMDCTTFVEYVVAISLAIYKEKEGFLDFATWLNCIRYRDGIIDGYPSRLHYFTDWIENNSRRGILSRISDTISTHKFDATVSFMTQNRHLYKQLSNSSYFKKMIEIEETISGYRMKYIPKEEIKSHEKHITNGDIIAFTTRIDGLDVTHTGLAYFENERLSLIHASTRSNKVEYLPVILDEYLAPMKNVTGILVARVIP